MSTPGRNRSRLAQWLVLMKANFGPEFKDNPRVHPAVYLCVAPWLAALIGILIVIILKN